MRIGVDLDGVLCDFGNEVVRVSDELYPGLLPYRYVPDNWDYLPYLNKVHWKAIWDKIKATNNFWVYLEPYQQNVDALRDFLEKNSGYEVFFVTARTAGMGALLSAQSSWWLQDHGITNINGNYTSVITVGADPAAKEAVLKALDIKFFIDDKGDTVEGLRRNFPELKSYLLDQPWNNDRDYFAPRVKSVKEYLQKVLDYKKFKTETAKV